MILEFISGPSSGVRISQQSTSVSGLSLRIGRVPENDLAVKDSEVYGKHALVNWNLKVSYIVIEETFELISPCQVL